MAKAVGLIGGLKGKVGNTVFRTRRGVQIASVYQPTVLNPKTKRQQLSRAKMAAAVAALKPFGLALRAGWQQVHPSYELQHAIAVAIPAGNLIITQLSPDAPPTVDMQALAPCLSAAQLARPLVHEPDFSDESRVKFVMDVPSSIYFDSDGSAIDAGAVVVVSNPANNDVAVGHQSFTRNATSVNIAVDVPAAWSGMEVEVYVFIKQIPVAVNGIQSTSEPWMYPAKTSATVYVGEGTIS